MEARHIGMLLVLTKLGMTSNGTTAHMDADSGGGSARHHDSTIPRLGAHDAPHLFYAALWDDAETDEQREQILARAIDELDRIQHSRADRTTEESKEDRDERIVEEGVGFPALEVARHFHCGELDVRRARAAAGCDEDYGQLPIDGKAMPTQERQLRVAAMVGMGMTASQITFALGVSYSTIARDLGRRKGY